MTTSSSAGGTSRGELAERPERRALRRDLRERLEPERRLAGQQLVEHGAERVDVGRGAHVLAERLLGSQVCRGAEHGARQGQARGLDSPCDPEVRDLEHAVAPEQEVLRLHVPMDEARVVGVLERRGRLAPEPGRLVGLEPAAPREQVGDRLAVDELHHDVRPALVLARVEDPDDVRVRQPRREPGLAQEPGAELRVAPEVLGEQLDGDRPVQLLVVGAEDGGHAAVTERPPEPVPARDEPRGQWPFLWWCGLCPCFGSCLCLGPRPGSGLG